MSAQGKRRSTGGREGKDVETALLDATEVLLEREGFSGISTRKVAGEAGVNPALVHYYFDSIEDLCARVMERVSKELIARQREIFGGQVSLVTQWHLATEPLRSNIGRRRMKVWFELSAMALSRPSLLRKMVEVNAEWRKIIRDGIDRNRQQWNLAASRGADEGLAGFSPEALSALMSVILKGLYWENLQEFHEGHEDLMRATDRVLTGIEAPAPDGAPRSVK